MITEADVGRALARVRDPELDEPLTELGFVTGVAVQGAHVRVRLRLPTYFCAPNFAYLMVADARAAVEALPGVERAEIVLEDHAHEDEINTAVAAGEGFAAAFPGEAEDELRDLRDLFARKGFLARQARLCEALRRAPEELAALRLGELPDVPELAPYLERRRELGLDGGPDAPALVLPDGRPVPARAAAGHLRIARLVRLSVEGNAGLCRSLLRTRYGIPDPEETTVR
jgi:metal-sulfur cluster biosynthetic enzyme